MILRSAVPLSSLVLLVLSLVAFAARERAAAAQEGGRVLAPGDLITVQIWEFEGPNKATTFEQHVGRNGAVPLPLIGDVQVAGKNLVDAGHAVDKAFADSQMMARARAVVTFMKAGNKPLSLSPGDRVRVWMWNLEGPGKVTEYEATLANDGTIPAPYLRRARLDGMTESQAMKSLAFLYAEAHLVAHLPVTVTRLDTPTTAPATQP